MIQALATGALVFVLTVILLSAFETALHVITKNTSKNYRWGVLVFSLLLAIWGFLTSLGR